MIQAGTAPGRTDLASVPTGGPGYAVSGVPAGTYYVRVRSVRAGAMSGPSGEVAVVVR